MKTRNIYLPNSSTISHPKSISLEITLSESCDENWQENIADSIAEALQDMLNNRLAIEEEQLTLTKAELECVLKGLGSFGEGGVSNKVWLLHVDYSSGAITVKEKESATYLPGSRPQGDISKVFEKIASILSASLIKAMKRQGK